MRYRRGGQHAQLIGPLPLGGHHRHRGQQRGVGVHHPFGSPGGAAGVADDGNVLRASFDGQRCRFGGGSGGHDVEGAF